MAQDRTHPVTRLDEIRSRLAAEHQLTVNVDAPKATELWVNCSCGRKGKTFGVYGATEAEFDAAKYAAFYDAQGHYLDILLTRIEALEKVAPGALDSPTSG